MFLPQCRVSLQILSLKVKFMAASLYFHSDTIVLAFNVAKTGTGPEHCDNILSKLALTKLPL